ncbi:MAG: Eco57I restriction-modification methylase domain-containing protein [Anaerolineae bacterium]
MLTSATRKAELGQYFTSAPIASFMASLFAAIQDSEVSLLDAGAGNGMLTAAFVDRWLTDSSDGCHAHVTAYELDEEMVGYLEDALNSYATRAYEEGHTLTSNVYRDDFIEAASRILLDDHFEGFTHAILNPPYKKLGNHSYHKQLLQDVGIESVNLYSAFVALAILLLRPHGELVAIIPRSFCNGPYYLPFRKLILNQASIRNVHLFEARDKAFGGDGVLQENIVIRLVKTVVSNPVCVSHSTDATFTDYASRNVPRTEIVRPDDPDLIIHIPKGPSSERKSVLANARCSLDELDIQVSTGPIVDFRLKEHLRDNLIAESVPLLYPGHFVNQRSRYPISGSNKPNAIMVTPDTEKWLYPSGHYVLVRRFSSKEERKRVIANVLLPTEIATDRVGFENHLNVFHVHRKGLQADLAFGLAGYLNSTFVDEYFREFSGHTQVNASDLRFLPYPSLQILIQLGQEFLSLPALDQSIIDSIVAVYL